MSIKDKDPREPPLILLDYAQLVELRRRGLVLCHTTPLLSALGTIADVARGDAYTGKPRPLAEVGEQLSGLVPYGYQNHFNPPLSAEQLCIIMVDPESIPYVQSKRPGVIGDEILADLERIAKHYKYLLHPAL